MKRFRIWLGPTLAALACALPAVAADEEPPAWCRFAFSDVPKDAPQFEQYSVAAEKIAHPNAVDVRHGDARLYRTNLRAAAKDGVNFAGHYAIANWGCGTGCLDWGMVDLKSGTVHFDASLRPLDNYFVDFDRDAETERLAKKAYATYVFGVLMFRPDSSLLIAMGSPDIEPKRAGVGYYRWSGARFERLKFYPAASICPKPKD